MIDGLSFIAYVVVIGIWILVWGALGAIVANARSQAASAGFTQGALLGPLGVILIPLLSMFQEKDRSIDLTPKWDIEELTEDSKPGDLYG